MVLPLQDDVVYGPIMSRRLGRSLGINLMPSRHKLCSFNCVYCHYGWTELLTSDAMAHAQDLPSVERIVQRLEVALRSALEFDYITFSGNGEPTLHPQFAVIVDQLRRLRDRFRPLAKLALLSNSTCLGRPAVRDCIAKIDLPVFKLDAGTEDTFHSINRPAKGLELAQILQWLTSIRGILLQTVLVDGAPSNVAGRELETYFEHIARIQPQEVHIYSIDRPAADPRLIRVPPQRLQGIAQRGSALTGVKFRAFWM